MNKYALKAAVYLFLIGAAVLVGYFVQKETYSLNCDSPPVMTLLTAAANDAQLNLKYRSIFLGASFYASSITGQKQTGYDKKSKKKICSANISFTKHNPAEANKPIKTIAEYEVTLENKDLKVVIKDLKAG